MKPKTPHLLATLILSVGLSSCEQQPKDLREWTPADHHNNKTGPVRADQSTGEADPNRPEGLDDVTLATWSQNCAACHGRLGRGDGPQGLVLGAKDLSLPDYQANVSDEYLTNTIRTGKGKMPSFAHLPESTVGHLVQLIRWFGKRRSAEGEPPHAGGAASAAPPASAATAGAPAASSAPQPAPDPQRHSKPKPQPTGTAGASAAQP